MAAVVLMHSQTTSQQHFRNLLSKENIPIIPTTLTIINSSITSTHQRILRSCPLESHKLLLLLLLLLRLLLLLLQLRLLLLGQKVGLLSHQHCRLHLIRLLYLPK